MNYTYTVTGPPGFLHNGLHHRLPDDATVKQIDHHTVTVESPVELPARIGPAVLTPS